MALDATIIFIYNRLTSSSLDNFGIDCHALMYYNLCFSGVTFYCFLYHPNLVSMPLIVMNGAEKFFFCLTERGDSSGTTLRTNYFLGQSIVSVHRIENEAYAVSW